MYYIESTDPRVAEGGMMAIPADFLENHQLSRSPYDGTFSEITESNEYPSFDACGKALLARLKLPR